MLTRAHTHRSSSQSAHHRGLTLLELLVTLVISAIAVTITLQALNGANHSISIITGRSQAFSTAHQTLDNAGRYLQGSRPLGACMDSGSPTAQSALSCLQVVESGPALRQFQTCADGTAVLDFYSYADRNPSAAPTNANGNPSFLGAPDLVRLSIDTNYQMWVEIYKPDTNATYTNPTWTNDPGITSWCGSNTGTGGGSTSPQRAACYAATPPEVSPSDHPAQTIYVGTVAEIGNTDPIHLYSTSASNTGGNTEITPANGVASAADLANTSLIEVSASFTWCNAPTDGSGTVQSDIYVPLSGSSDTTVTAP